MTTRPVTYSTPWKVLAPLVGAGWSGHEPGCFERRAFRFSPVHKISPRYSGMTDSPTKDLYAMLGIMLQAKIMEMYFPALPAKVRKRKGRGVFADTHVSVEPAHASVREHAI